MKITLFMFAIFTFVFNAPAFAKGEAHEHSGKQHHSLEVSSEHSETSEGVETERTVYNDENGNSLVVEKNIVAHEGIETEKSVDINGNPIEVTKSVNTQRGTVTVTENIDGKTETKTVSF